MERNKDKKILCLDTSGDRCEVALGVENIGIEARILVNRPNIHSEYLAELTRQLLDNLSLKVSDLDALALVTGPGSFTGLRIGMSFAKGIAYGAGLPVIGITAFEAIAGKISEEIASSREIVPILDARRDEFFYQRFKYHGESEKTSLPIPMGEPEIASASKIKEKTDTDAVLMFYGSPDATDALRNKTERIVIPAYPDADAIFQNAIKRLNSGKIENLDKMVPFYMRSFAGIM